MIESDRSGSNPLSSRLNDALFEQLLERADARAPTRSLQARTPAIAIRVTARLLDASADGLGEAVHDVAGIAIASFVDRGMLAVVRPNRWPTFVLPLPWIDEPGLDEVVVLCRQLDEAQLRTWVVAWAETFQGTAARRLATVGLVVELRLAEGAIVDPPPAVGALLPASAWRTDAT